MSKILLTGGTGYIGSHTAVSLVENGDEVVVIDNLVNSTEESIHNVEKLKSVHITTYIGDVRDEALLDKIFTENKIDLVIHFAGLKAVGESVGKPLEYYENNLNSTIALLKSMLRNKVYKIVYSSSATVYDPSNEPERKEGMLLGCSNPYGWTKLMSEQIITDTVHAYPELDAISLRYFNPVGAHPSGVIGENPVGIPNNLMPYIQQVSAGKREFLHVYGDDYNTEDGTGVRDYVHVCDLAEAHVAASEYLLKHKCCLALNVGTGKGVSVLELVHTYEAVNNLTIPYHIEGRRPGDVDCFFANTEKANKTLNWKATRNIEDMCKDAYHYQTMVEGKGK